MKATNWVIDQGFTLMELLIALALFSAIMGILMNSFFQFHQQSDRMEALLQLRQELRILEQIVRKDIQNAIYLEQFMTDPQKLQDGRKSGIFCENQQNGEQSRDRLYMHVNSYSRFYRNLPREHDPEVHEVSYYLEEVDLENFLFKRREEFYVDPDITEGERSIEHTLSHRIISFDVKFYKSNETEPIDEWDSSIYQTSGNAADKMPTGVVVSLEIKSKSGESLKSEMEINLQPYMGQNVNWR